MKINFAQVPAQAVDVFGEEGLFGPDDSGNFYYNYVEFGTNPGGTDEIAIVDGCNRYMPIAVESIPELITALREFYYTKQYLDGAQKLEDYVNSDAQGFTAETGVEYEPLQSVASWPFRN